MEIKRDKQENRIINENKDVRVRDNSLEISIVLV